MAITEENALKVPKNWTLSLQLRQGGQLKSPTKGRSLRATVSDAATGSMPKSDISYHEYEYIEETLTFRTIRSKFSELLANATIITTGIAR